MREPAHASVEHTVHDQRDNVDADQRPDKRAHRSDEGNDVGLPVRPCGPVDNQQDHQRRESSRQLDTGEKRETSVQVCPDGTGRKMTACSTDPACDLEIVLDKDLVEEGEVDERLLLRALLLDRRERRPGRSERRDERQDVSSKVLGSPRLDVLDEVLGGVVVPSERRRDGRASGQQAW